MIEYQEPNADGDTDVEMYRWSVVSAPDVIGTTGLNGCIGVAVLNDTRARAWVLHSPNMTHDPEGLRAMLLDARDDCADSDRIRVVLTGGRGDGSAGTLAEDRRITLEIVANELPGATVGIAWGVVEDFMVAYKAGAWQDIAGCPQFAL